MDTARAHVKDSNKATKLKAPPSSEQNSQNPRPNLIPVILKHTEKPGVGQVSNLVTPTTNAIREVRTVAVTGAEQGLGAALRLTLTSWTPCGGPGRRRQRRRGGRRRGAHGLNACGRWTSGPSTSLSLSLSLSEGRWTAAQV